MDYNKILSTWWSGTCYYKEQLDMIISSLDIKAYAYILHDKDKNDNGELKKPHYHFLVQLYKNQRGSWFKMFATDDMGIVFIQPCHYPKSAYDYLIHDTQTARKQGKYLYDTNERTSTIENFEADEKLDENKELYDDIICLLEGKITWRELIRKKPKRIHMIANIKVAHDMLYFESHRIKYSPNIYLHKKATTTPPKIIQIPDSFNKINPTPKLPDIVPIPNPEELPW